MKKNAELKKLVVAKETVRALDRRETLIAVVGGMRPTRPNSEASHQDVCCA